MADDPTKTSWTVAELLAADFPEPNWIVPNKFPAGLGIFGGRPKIGKSWFLLQVAIAVGSNGKGRILDTDVPAGKVLYLALEDSARRLQSRIRAMNIPPECQITFRTQWAPFQGKGIDLLATEIEQKGYSFVVVDTLTRATPGVDHAKPEVIGPIVSRLQTLATLHNNGIELVDHTRKPSGIAADPIDDIISSTAKTANADYIYALYREQGKAGARLLGRGRDVEEVDISLIWDRDTYAWQSRGNSGEIELTERRSEILSALDEGKATAATIAKTVGQDPGNTRKRLNDLVNSGLITIEDIEGKRYYGKK